ncbi:phospholipase A2 inhibitor and Ly6/PLAUR domain-containing protein-like isoform X2 [Dendropsophus ebraccatus]|uniref:phospholipase A2 inhibitor and Ly6/PLAUR domain-containing protein-like isoform X2 n=1 Tax=Dendropsophus ebraccatus TaxID=150705 RepID=UPI003831583C
MMSLAGILSLLSALISTNGTTTASLLRDCINPTRCGIKGSISLQDARINMAISCCNTYACTPTIPALIPKSSNPNGVVCRVCTSKTSSWCYTSDTLQCTGEENMCLLQTKEVTGAYSSSIAARGCATKSLCKLGTNLQNVPGSSIKDTIICTDGGISVHKAILTPAITCLLVLKLFF